MRRRRGLVRSIGGRSTGEAREAAARRPGPSVGSGKRGVLHRAGQLPSHLLLLLRAELRWLRGGVSEPSFSRHAPVRSLDVSMRPLGCCRGAGDGWEGSGAGRAGRAVPDGAEGREQVFWGAGRGGGGSGPGAGRGEAAAEPAEERRGSRPTDLLRVESRRAGGGEAREGISGDTPSRTARRAPAQRRGGHRVWEEFRRRPSTPKPSARTRRRGATVRAGMSPGRRTSTGRRETWNRSGSK